MNRLLLMGLLALTCSAAMAQQVVTGKVTDEGGQSLPGVNVIIKGTSIGVSTDSDGNYSISATDDNSIFVFSFIGFSSQEVSLNGRSRIDVTLTEDLKNLEEVVVIGYGTVKKSDLTGSVVSVSSEQLKAVPVTTFDQALQGRAAGVFVTQSTGAPGGGTNIRIRGTTSVNASSEPLFVIDGLLINTNVGEMSIASRGPAINPLSTINPSDIESIEILKDASATAIYGSRAANGVVLITTKKGKAGKPTLSFDSYYGVQNVAHKLDLLNASQFNEFVNEAKQNAGSTDTPLNTNVGSGTDWQDELFRPAPMANYQLSMTGGNEKTRYALGGGYFTQEGIIIGSEMDRYSFRSNIETDASTKLTVGSNLSYNRTVTKGVFTGPSPGYLGVVANALRFNPNLPVYDDTEIGGYTKQNDVGLNEPNPVAEARAYEYVATSSRILGSVFVQYRIIDDLVFKSNFGIDDLSTKVNSFGPDFLKRTESSQGEASISTLNALTWISTNTLTYNKKINSNNSITVLAGFESQKFANESLVVNAEGVHEAKTGWHNISNTTEALKVGNGETQWSILSYFGRINYSLANKYLFTVTGRSDGSSKFADGHKWGFFPSGAFAWKVAEEPFMQGVDFIADLKLRASYGRTGNQAIPPYTSLSLITGSDIEGVFSNGPLQGSTEAFKGKQPKGYPNLLLSWETTDQANIGIDISVLQGRLNLTAEAYSKLTKDLLFQAPIPYTTGFSSSLTNVGNVKNQGVDLMLNSINADGKVRWTTSFNISFNHNEITSLLDGGNDVSLGVNRLRIGQPVGSFYGYIFDGIYQDAEDVANSPGILGKSPSPGDRKYKDISGPNGVPDGVITTLDQTIIGNAQPDFTWGLDNSITFKNFTLSFFFQGSQGNKIYNQNLGFLENLDANTNVLADAWLNRWTPENPSNEYARAFAGDPGDRLASTRQIEDASYFRLKNLTIGYNMPKSALEKIRLNNARIYVSGTNLWTITDYKGYDPEVNAYGYSSNNLVGVDNGGYPLSTTYNVGLSLGF